MNHSRRGFFGLLSGVAAAAGVDAEPVVIESQPPPVALVLKSKNRLSPAAREAIRKAWVKLHSSLKQPLIILDDGMELEAIR